ncbi:MAG: NAD(P)/FAD-dependent oxidoreductase [Chitinophagaceae bacterium]
MKAYEAVIVGGSYAGLSAAMALGRAMRSVLIIDSGMPCNRQTPHSHNFITHDGEKPAIIASKAQEQVLRYPTVQLLKDKVTNVSGSINQFIVETAGKEQFTARRVLFATGMKDLFPDIPGIAECWGISVIHCPYCHGYEVRGEKTGIMANGEIGTLFSRLVNQWTKDLTLFTNGPAILTDENRQVLQRKNIAVIEKQITSIEHDNGYIQHLVFNDGSRQALTALYAKLPMEQHCTIPQELGCELLESGFIKVDDFQKTTVPGIYAAGDNTIVFRSVSAAVAAGTKAGAMMNHSMMEEE